MIQTFKEHILGMAWQILLKFGIEGASTQRNLRNEICTEKIVCYCSGSVELQMCENGIKFLFFTPIKYTLVCLASQGVSWAA